MLGKLRHLRLSLAAKCELLFGLAVALVILAAVFLPWLRMEQLTGELNQRTAEALIDNALDDHVAYWKGQGGEENGRVPEMVAKKAAPRPGSTTRPATEPTRQETGYGARLMLLTRFAEEATPLERRALGSIQKSSNEQRYSKVAQAEDGTYKFRYVRLVHMSDLCISCHRGDTNLPKGMALKKTAFAMASVVIPSQVDPNELLLNRMFIFVAALLAGSVAVLFFWFIISKLILDPVRILQETAEKVSEGDLNIRTHIPSGDEFQVLSATFNKMLENLKKGEEQLQAINKSLDLKLAEMSESNLALYESNRLKSEFLANVSHELRTPLNSILGFAELLRDAAKDNKEGRYVQNIMNSGRSLLDLINDLLDLAKIEAGRMEIRANQFSLSDLFEGLSSILRPLIEQKQLVMEVKVAGDVPLMTSDAAKLQQVLYNFLSNAIKFSPPGGKFELAASRQAEDRVRISVTDHGPGIAADKQHMIFEKFRQIDASHTRQFSGTGLGLAISRDLTQLLGGMIGVESEAGKGATFWVELPIKIDSSTQDVRDGAVAEKR